MDYYPRRTFNATLVVGNKHIKIDPTVHDVGLALDFIRAALDGIVDFNFAIPWDHSDFPFVIEINGIDVEKDKIGKKGQWQPIETAPKDGTRIIGLCSRLSVTTIKFVSAFEGDAPAWFSGELGKYVSPITHWMPLPEPPDQTISDGLGTHESL